MSERPTGFTCSQCGTEHKFSLYVHAHWSDALTHTCECGAKHTIIHGKAKRQAAERKRRKP